MKSILIHIKNNLGLYLLAGLFGFLFFYRLDYSTLTSWDEAWYASISREMMRSGDLIHMNWNGNPYYDHPPMGFWLMAMSYKLFGINELATRIPSAILGLGSMVLMYLTGLFFTKKKEVGFAAAIILGTSVWYTIRVRSGNLDSAFVFFYILTIYTSLKSSKNFRWFPITMAAGAALFMTKTLVGASVIPLMLYLNAGQLINFKKNYRKIIIGIVVALLIILPWYYLNYLAYSNFIEHHFFRIGARSKSFASYFTLYAKQPLFFLHMGVRKWYYFWILGIGGIISLFIRKKLIKFALFLLLWNFVVLYPFLTAPETELWHLIPVYIPMALIAAVGLDALNPLGKYVYLAGITVIGIWQITIFYHEVIPENKYIPHDVGIAISAAQYNKQIYLDDDFFPIAVFYTDQRVLPLYDLESFGGSKEIDTMVKLFQSNEEDFVVITRSWAVNNLIVEEIPYKLLKDNGSFSIVTRP